MWIGIGANGPVTSVVCTVNNITVTSQRASLCASGVMTDNTMFPCWSGNNVGVCI
ncbi:MAG: hypothetical protein LBJ95_02285 [Oscillospiraceae bacterium]|nr:hypothetical protein [Oscillospiraceae bacterium]